MVTRNSSIEVAPIALARGAIFSPSCDRELRPMTLMFELDLDMVKMNRQVKYLGQR